MNSSVKTLVILWDFDKWIESPWCGLRVLGVDRRLNYNTKWLSPEVHICNVQRENKSNCPMDAAIRRKSSLCYVYLKHFYK